MGDQHDAFFRRVFGRVDLAAELWRRVLPPAVFGLLDVERAERIGGQRIGDDLRARRADLVFRVPLRGPGDHAAMLLLVEHQSRVDPLMAFRGLEYGMQAVAEFIEEHRARRRRAPRHLPAMIPIVVHQGPRPWRGPRRLSALYDLPPDARVALGAHLPEVELLIDDLACTDDDAIERSTRHPLAAAALMVMRYVRRERSPAAFIRRWARRIDAALADPGARPLVEVMTRYLYTSSARLRPEDVVAVVTTDSIDHPEVFVNLAQKFEEQGVRRGIEQGIEQGSSLVRPTLERMLAHRFGAPTPAVSARIAAADLRTLVRWTERVLLAETLDEVFADDAEM